MVHKQQVINLEHTCQENLIMSQMSDKRKAPTLGKVEMAALLLLGEIVALQRVVEMYARANNS